MQIARIWFVDGTHMDVPIDVEKTENGFRISLPVGKVPRGAEKVDFLPDEHWADAREDRYLVLPRGWDSPCDMLCTYEEREDYTYESGYMMMPWFGMKTRDRCFIAVFTGLWSEHSQYVTIRHDHSPFFRHSIIRQPCRLFGGGFLYGKGHGRSHQSLVLFMGFLYIIYIDIIFFHRHEVPNKIEIQLSPGESAIRSALPSYGNCFAANSCSTATT